LACDGSYVVSSVSDIEAISACESISGSLTIGSPTLTHVDGRSNLSFVGGGVSIQENIALINVDGLSSLTTTGSDFWITGNTALTNLDGLSALSSVGSRMFIEDNASLCQSLVDAFISGGCTFGSTISTSGNDSSC
jgi:hypothetical protein